MPAEALGAYVLVERLGSTPIGEGYKGFRTGTAPEEREFVIVHLLHQAFSDRPGFIDAMRQRCVRFGQLDDGHFARPVDVGDTGEIAYVVTEYYGGTTLDHYMAAPELISLEHRLAIARGILDSVRAAHEAGLVVGSLAPRDIVVSNSGELRITQLGQYELTRIDSGLSALLPARWFAGRSHFDAPELVNSTHPGTVAADCYSAAVCVRFALTGRFPSANGETLSLQEPRLAAGIDALLLEISRADPAKRQTNLHRLLARWDRLPWDVAPPPAAAAAHRSRPKRPWLAFSVVIAVALIAVAGLLWRPWDRKPDGPLQATAAGLTAVPAPVPEAIRRRVHGRRHTLPAYRFPQLQRMASELFPKSEPDKE